MVYTILSLGVIATLSVAGVLVIQKKYSYLTRWFLFPLLGGMMWTIGWLIIHILQQQAIEYSIGYTIGTQSILIGLTALPLGLIIATLYYPFSKNHLHSKSIVSIGIMSFFIILMIPLFIMTSYINKDGNIVHIEAFQNNPFFTLYQIGLILVLLISLGILFSRLKYIRSNKDKVLANYFMVGYLFTITGYVCSVTLIPLQGSIQLMKYAPLVLMIWIGFIIAGVIRYKMLDVQVFVSQVIIMWSIIIVGVITFSNTSIIALIVDMVFLIIFGFLGVILIKSLHQSAQTKKKLYQNNRTLQRFIKVKDNFLRMTTHQLRTPVIILEEYTKSIILKLKNQKKLYNKEIDYLEKIAINNHRLKEVMEDLTLAYAIGGNQFNIRDILPLNIVSIIETIIEDLHMNQEYSHIDIRLDKANQQYIAQGQLRYIELALRKIIENAYMFAHQKIVIRLRSHKEYINITVIDDGMGINQDDMRHIFTPFTRGSQASTLYPNGSGLGLYLARHIIREHKGKLAMISPAYHDKGVEVDIILPKTIV